MGTYDNYSDAELLALCIWREAQNQIQDAQFGVGCSIRNRVQQPRWWGRDYRSVILDPFQYSSFNADDPNSLKFPHPEDATSWGLAQTIASEVMNGAPDTTDGAVSYFDDSLDDDPPSWALSPQFVHTVDIDDFHFYALADGSTV